MLLDQWRLSQYPFGLDEPERVRDASAASADADANAASADADTNAAAASADAVC